MKFDYVASGMAHMMGRRAYVDEAKEQLLKDYIAVKQYAQNFGHDISILFNAFLEVGLGKLIKDIVKDNCELYADSGGLQIVTQGKVVTPDLKQNIYSVQGEMSKYAMSFDQIPIITPEGRSGRNDTDNRFVDLENFERCAKQSGLNLKEQIDVFIENGYESKPFVIVHGYNLQSYQLWLDIILSQLTDEEIAHIGGIAVGAAALGQGELEDFERAFITANLKAPNNVKNHVHLLGVGSVKRVLPFIALGSNGSIADEVLLSYDSTSHTSGMSMANFQVGARLYSMSGTCENHNHGEYARIFNVLSDYSNKIFDNRVTPEQMKFAHLMPCEKFIQRGLGSGAEFHIAMWRAMWSSVLQMVESVAEVNKSYDALTNLINVKSANQYLSFRFVKDEKDFGEWLKLNRTKVKSKRVGFVQEQFSIEDFL